MRPTPALLALLLALPTPPARAAVVVDSVQRTLESSQFRLQFSTSNPDRVRELIWKPWSPTQNLAAQDFGDTQEYFGQTLGELSGPPLVDPALFVEATWIATQVSSDEVTVTCRTQSEGGPRLITQYTFGEGRDWFLVSRTIDFTEMRAATPYQPFVPRLAPVGPYRTVRWRDVDGVVRMSTFCFAGCLAPTWDQTWTETELRVGNRGVAIALLTLAGTPNAAGFVHGHGPSANGAWAAPQHDPHGTGVETHRHAVRASLTAGQAVSLDSLRAAIDAPFLAAPPPAARALELRVDPTPARVAAAITFTLPVAAHVAIEVFDANGRRIETLTAGARPAGPHRFEWAPPARAGLYFVRIRTPAAEATRRIVVTR